MSVAYQPDPLINDADSQRRRRQQFAPPLPVRDGVNPTKLRLPLTGPWPTVADYMLDRFEHLKPEALAPRFARGEVRAADGSQVTATTPIGAHEFIWYYRDVPNEQKIPFPITVLYQDDNLVVADKPHFLSTTPGGKFVQETALVRLRNQLSIPDLVPLHRLDRATAGVLLFSPNPDTRGAYQVMFENRQIQRTYQAVSPMPMPDPHEFGSAAAEPVAAVPTAAPTESAAETRFPLVYRSRILKTKGVVTAYTEAYGPEVSGRLEAPRTGKQRRRTDPTTGPNAQTRIELLATGEGGGQLAGTQVAHFQLTPHTGRTHQLRIHLAALGVPIAFDPFYPVLLDDGPDDFSRPLQLLASDISFTDPLTGQHRHFESQLYLQEEPRNTNKRSLNTQKTPVNPRD